MEILSDEGDLYSDDDDTNASFVQITSTASSRGANHDSARLDRNIPSAADRRAHHNALERKRRDHIKDSFSSLRDSVPSLQGEKASRAQILKKAAEYIQFMRKKNTSFQSDIEEIKKQNAMLEEQIRLIERQGSRSVGAISPSSVSSNSGHRLQSSMSLLSNDSLNGLIGSSPSGYNGNVIVGEDVSEENSNESSSTNGNGSPESLIINGNGANSRLSLDSVSVSSPPPASNGSSVSIPINIPKRAAQHNLTTSQAQILINGIGTSSQSTITPVRSIVKNGANTIIVQNQNSKTITGPHQVIQVASSSSSSSNGSNTITATPIIISALANGSSNNSGASSTTTYTVVNKTSASANGGVSGASTISFVPTTVNNTGTAFRTVVVQQPSSGQTQNATSTPSIHFVSTNLIHQSSLPTGASGTTTKRIKISSSSTTKSNNSS